MFGTIERTVIFLSLAGIEVASKQGIFGSVLIPKLSRPAPQPLYYPFFSLRYYESGSQSTDSPDRRVDAENRRRTSASQCDRIPFAPRLASSGSCLTAFHNPTLTSPSIASRNLVSSAGDHLDLAAPAPGLALVLVCSEGG